MIIRTLPHYVNVDSYTDVESASRLFATRPTCRAYTVFNI